MKVKIYLNLTAFILAAIAGTYLCLVNEVTIGCLALGSAFFSGLRALAWYQKEAYTPK